MLIHKSYKKQFIHHKLGGIHTRNAATSVVHQKTIHTSQKNEEGFNTSHQLIHKSICTSHIGIPQIDSYNIQGAQRGGEARRKKKLSGESVPSRSPAPT
jgi:hypothetical protein